MMNDYNDFFSRDVQAFKEVFAKLEQCVDPHAKPRMNDDHYKTITETFDRVCNACERMDSLLVNEPKQLEEAKARFRDEIRPCLNQSWIYERALTKPRGYPGDGELLSVLYDYTPLSTGLPGYIDLFLLNTTLACAIRERLRCAKTFLLEELEHRHGDVSILNVACGPVREYEGGIEHPADTKVHITCLDTDEETLKYVASRSAAGAQGDLDVKCVCHNALRTSSAQNNIRKFGQPDIVYSIGLCDYIPDKYLIPMLQGWRETINDDGVVYVAFKDTRRYSHQIYQWLMDWYFFLRTEEDVRSLFEQAGYDPYGLKMTRDSTGSIFNFMGRKKKLPMIRIDRAERRVGEPLAPAIHAHSEQLVN